MNKISQLQEKWYDLFIKKDYILAEKVFKEILEYDNRNDDALFFLCQIYDYLKNYKMLYQYSLKRLQYLPTNIVAIHDHERALKNLYDNERVLYFWELIMTHKGNKKLEWSRWICYYLSGYKSEAYTSLKNAVKVNKENLHYLNRLVSICIELEKHTEAEKYHNIASKMIKSGKYLSDNIYKNNDELIKNQERY